MKAGVQIEFMVTPQLSDPSNPKFGEWPPTPDRVFQALVATAAETKQNMEILKCLESAPSIKASRAEIPTAPINYVPANFKNSKGYHPNAKRYLPVVLPESRIVTYVWEDVPQAAAASLTSIVEQLTHIGRASSLVRATLIDGSKIETNWVPSNDGGTMMRVPYPGRLNNLQTSFEAGLRSHPAISRSYQNVQNNIPTTAWGELMVLRTERQLELTGAARWAEALRKAIMSIAKEEIPSFVHGHDEHRHVAWAAIPNVGHKHASGNILGLGCWLPKDATLKEKGYLGSLLIKVSYLNGMKLRIDPTGLKSLQSSTWNRASTKWATVTPIALDRWPKRNKPAEQIVIDSLTIAGLPQPKRIVCSNHSPVKGAANARQYPSRNGNRYITHAEMEWDKPIGGPLLVGADRFFAGGLCLPMDRRSQ